MVLKCVTITGADDSTDPEWMLSTSREFEFVEWGILIGSGVGPRFPSIWWIEKLVEEMDVSGCKVNLSLHVCGDPLNEIKRGSSVNLSERLGSRRYVFRRVQLNWHGVTQCESAGEKVLSAFLQQKCRGWNPELIFQFDGVNNELWRHAATEFRCSCLFDQSHGAGVVPGEWPDDYIEIPCGWAGGLGPHNLQEQIPKIDSKAFRNYWIDMETHVRSDDDARLDCMKVRKCLEIASQFVG